MPRFALCKSPHFSEPQCPYLNESPSYHIAKCSDSKWAQLGFENCEVLYHQAAAAAAAVL